MRQGFLGGSLAGLAALAVTGSTKVYGFANIKRAIQRQGKTYGTTSCYMPHQGEQEIARRQRQKARLHQKYMMNGGFSRRGNEVGPI